ncbi:hypothetical protein BDD16_003795 [Sphaerotilus montanus]|uniref:Uncharacterized protein n=1 Tax=Sphaerotilus montanus TaxID=522889 RepID=A0A7Y9R398_9BURK|nr:hypothetical protein [Sphaerotilus montanus]
MAQRARQGHALLLSAGECGGQAVEEDVDVQPRGDLAHPALQRVAAVAAQPQRRGDVVEHRHRRVVDELLVDHRHVAFTHGCAGDVAAVDQHPAGGGHVETGHGAHQAGLAGLGGAQQHGDGAGLRRDRHVVQPGLGADTLADAVERQLHGEAFIVVGSVVGRVAAIQSWTCWRWAGV